MKKALATLLSLLMVAVLTVTASAAGSSVSLTPSAGSVYRGDTFTVVAELSNTEKIQMGTVLLEYDTAAFEMVGGECHVPNASIGTVLPDQKVGTFFLMAGKKVSGKLFAFEFKVLDAAAVGEYTIGVKASVGTGNGEDIEATGTQVTVAYRPGNLPEATTPEVPQTEATTPQKPESSGTGVEQPQTSEEMTVPQESGETVQPTGSTSPETTLPAQTDGATPKETLRKTGFVGIPVAAALVFALVKLGIRLFRKKKQ